MTRTPSITMFVLAMALSVRAGEGAPPAFPGAVGQGAQATGGRGGDVYHVTTLADYNPKAEPKIEGSFRHAVRSAEGPRTIVFDVAGPIALHAPLEIRKSDLTIAGQTSPGGVTFWGYPVEVSAAQNVILRHLRFRTGDVHARPLKGMQIADAGQRPPGNGDLDGASANALYVGNGSERVILDHVSAAWGIDEVLSVTRARDVTIQNSIIAEGLNNSFHPKGPHGYGSLVRGELTPADQARHVGGYTLYGNLWAHNRARNPSIGGQQSLERGQSEGDRRRTDLNLVNNVVYDWGDQATHRSEGGDVRINLIGNVFISGPAKKAKYFFRENTPGRSEVIAVGNWRDLDQDEAHNGAAPTDEAEIAQGFDGFGDGDRLAIDGEPLAFFSLVANATRPAEAAYDAVLEGAGASLWRDAIDLRIVDSVRQRTGGLVDSQEAFRGVDGKLPGIDDLPIAERDSDFDVDRDGIADAFEREHGLDPADPADGNAMTLSQDGYTNLEVYINELTTTPK
jgi:hypothetical protein